MLASVSTVWHDLRHDRGRRIRGRLRLGAAGAKLGDRDETPTTAAEQELAAELETIGARLMRQFRLRDAREVFTAATLLSPGTADPPPGLHQVDSMLANENTRSVDFLVVGVQKGGTTALNQFMRQHEQVCVPKFWKEAHYFDSGRLYSEHRAYHRLFFPHENTRVVGESTPAYLFVPGAIEAARLYDPGLKLIALLRDPIARTFSQWNMRRGRGETGPEFDFDELLLEYEAGDPFNRRNLLRRSLYVPQLTKMYDSFPADQILLLRSEDLQAEHDETLARVAAFLGIDPFPEIRKREAHARRYKVGLPAEAAERMREFFQDDVAEVSERFGLDTSDWLRT